MSNPLISAAVAATLLSTGASYAQTAAERLSIPAPDARDGTTYSVNGTDIFASSSGEGDAIVLLHGYPLSGALFERVRDRLDDNHQVITIDHRGYGNSSTPEVVTDVATYAEDALAVLSEMGIEKAVIGGMSMGGPIVMEMYRQNPDVFDGAIFIDSNHLPSSEFETGLWNGTLDTLAANSGNDYSSLISGDMPEGDANGDEPAIAAMVPFLMPNMLTGETRLVTAPAQLDYLTEAMKMASDDGSVGGAIVLRDRPDSTETIKSMDVAVLVLVGQEDTLYPVAVSQMMADAAPQGSITVVPGAAHALIFEKPDESADAILNWMENM